MADEGAREGLPAHHERTVSRGWVRGWASAVRWAYLSRAT